ncbi:hypothetical protein H4683_004210 [Filibacter limicola]|uniref:Uncharacterized protein n=1 Tax=Sporosarcina limicola TaxID=34101 RepID=A0A927MM23_9BACL|nr:hypothetical protein [Sporosarcina limicola]
MLIPSDSFPHFENMNYRPMILTILAKNREEFENGNFKLSVPYLKLIDQSMAAIQDELKESKGNLHI